MKRILFIGNSFTYVNDLPAMLQALAQGASFDIACRKVVKGGWFLSRFADPTDEMHAPLQAEYESGPWDHIVLQDQSLNPAKDPAAFHAAVNALCKQFPCESYLFYQTWAYEEGSEKLSATGLCYEELYLLLREAYRNAARAHNALCVPVGDGFALCRAQQPQINLYAPDHYHPSLAGTYLAACIFYASLSGQSPAHLNTVENLPPAQAALLRDIACQASKR